MNSPKTCLTGWTIPCQKCRRPLKKPNLKVSSWSKQSETLKKSSLKFSVPYTSNGKNYRITFRLKYYILLIINRQWGLLIDRAIARSIHQGGGLRFPCDDRTDEFDIKLVILYDLFILNLSLRSNIKNQWSADNIKKRVTSISSFKPAIHSGATVSGYPFWKPSFDHNMDVHKDVYYQVRHRLYMLWTQGSHYNSLFADPLFSLQSPSNTLDKKIRTAGDLLQYQLIAMKHTCFIAVSWYCFKFIWAHRSIFWSHLHTHAVGELLVAFPTNSYHLFTVELALKEVLALASAVKGLWYAGLPCSLTRRLCHADEPQQGRNSCPWLPLPGWYGCAHA